MAKHGDYPSVLRSEITNSLVLYHLPHASLFFLPQRICKSFDSNSASRSKSVVLGLMAFLTLAHGTRNDLKELTDRLFKFSSLLKDCSPKAKTTTESQASVAATSGWQSAVSPQLHCFFRPNSPSSCSRCSRC